MQKNVKLGMRGRMLGAKLRVWYCYSCAVVAGAWEGCQASACGLDTFLNSMALGQNCAWNGTSGGYGCVDKGGRCGVAHLWEEHRPAHLRASHTYMRHSGLQEHTSTAAVI
jgi:hypothetical protein